MAGKRKRRSRRRLAGERLETRDLLAVLLVSDASQFSQALNSASDGDEILMAPGTYSGSFYVEGLAGVTIRAEDPQARPVIDAGGATEVMHLVDPQRVTIDGLVLQNAAVNGINIDDGGDFSTPARDIVLRNMLIRDNGTTGNHDGVKLSGVVGFHLNRLHVENWGEGGSAVDMVGCHEGLIENSLFEHSAPTTGSGVRPKGGSSQIVIRANRFVGAGARPIQAGGSTGLQYFRPQPPGAVEADDIVAHGNVVIGSQTAAAYVNVDGGADFHHNLIYRPTRWVMRILYENSNPGFVETHDGSFHDNIVIWNEGDLSTTANVGPNTEPESFSFARNTWFNQTNPSSSTPNLPAPETDGVVGVDPQVSVDQIVPWQFSWGTWLVNATPNTRDFQAPANESLVLATPDDALASFDPDAASPLSGNWSFSPAAGETLVLEPFGQAILIAAASPLQVESVEINTELADPEDLPSGPQPATWQSQRSDLRSIAVQFSHPVVVTPDDLRLENLGVNAPAEQDVEIPLTEGQLALTGNRLTISFPSQALPDGAYQLTILGAVSDADGNLLDGNGDGVGGDAYVFRADAANQLYKLTADFTADQGVSIFDFGVFVYWFGQPTGVAPSYVDLNSDGGVSIFDFVPFSEQFAVGIVFPTSLRAGDSAAASNAARNKPSAAKAADAALASDQISRPQFPPRGLEHWTPLRRQAHWRDEDRERVWRQLIDKLFADPNAWAR